VIVKGCPDIKILNIIISLTGSTFILLLRWLYTEKIFPQEGLGVGLGCYTKKTYKKTVGVVWYSFSPIFVLDYMLLVYAHFINFYKWRAFCSKKYKK
jgi:hypothetical protein